MRLPRIFRTTTFRMTLLFLAVFAMAAAAFLFYAWFATAGEVTRRADAEITREMNSLEAVYRRGGAVALNQALIERAGGERPFLYLLLDKDGKRMTGTIAESPIEATEDGENWATFSVTDVDMDGGETKRPARGLQERLAGGETLFVGADIGESRGFVSGIVNALWGAGALVILLGLAGGAIVSRNVSRHMAGLTDTVAAVRGGDLKARARVRGVHDEYDELAEGLNEMLDRLERSMGGLRHAGDAIAHDLRSPLTRLRARMEAALIEVEAGKGDPKQALVQALDDADGVLNTFNAVLAIARLQAAGEAPDQSLFDPGQLAADMAELYEPLCEDKGLDFKAELVPGLQVKAARPILAQALANIIDNAIKYTPAGGAVMLRVRRRSSGE
ncbi:MAG TPA: HAMP domain-containing protein, partial [Caulobacter sp.]|nr:HAMP domain-containing protein [Caulobacter sp.]